MYPSLLTSALLYLDNRIVFTQINVGHRIPRGSKRAHVVHIVVTHEAIRGWRWW